MKLRLLAFVSAALAVSSAFAKFGQYGALFYFTTDGNELYADGSLAMDGECYALVWQRNGVAFKGFNATGTIGYDETATLPVDPQNCRVLEVWPAVENDGEYAYCLDCYTRVEKDFYRHHGKKGDEVGDGEMGTFSIYLFDTRIWKNGEATVGGYDANAKTVPVLNGYGVVSFLEEIDMVEGSDSWNPDSIDKKGLIPEVAVPARGDVNEDETDYKDTSIAAASAVPAEAQANIKVGAPVVGDGEVTISVTGVPAYLRIDLSAATELGDVGKAGTLVGEPKQGGETLTWTLPLDAKAKKGFYKVVRQPLNP